MDEIKQAREGLLIYLEANSTYIEEKVYNQFNVECTQNRTLQTLDIYKMKKTIKEIFDFGDNKVYEYFFSNLEGNIKNYIKEQYSAKAISSFYVLDIEKLTDIVKYCINHGFDENARKTINAKAKDTSVEKEIKKAAPVPKSVVTFIQEEKKIEPPQDEFAHVKSKVSTFLERDKIPEKKEFKLQKFSMPDNNVLPRYLASIQKATIVKEEEEDNRIIVSPLDDAYLNAHRKTLKERFQKLFNFYCLQQHSLGMDPTFDRIKDNGKLMNLGKFMQFCQYTKLFSCKQITKDTLITQFKRNSEGKLEITFQVFEKIIQKLDEKYLKAMGHDAINNPIPTYEARLLLNEPNKLGELKKHRHLIFGTRSKQGREVNEYAQATSYPKKQLTLHSGRFSSDLSIDFKQKSLSKPKSTQKAKPLKLSSAPIHLNQLKKLKLPKISWIVEQQDDQYLPNPHKI